MSFHSQLSDFDLKPDLLYRVWSSELSVRCATVFQVNRAEVVLGMLGILNQVRGNTATPRASFHRPATLNWPVNYFPWNLATSGAG